MMSWAFVPPLFFRQAVVVTPSDPLGLSPYMIGLARDCLRESFPELTQCFTRSNKIGVRLETNRKLALSDRKAGLRDRRLLIEPTALGADISVDVPVDYLLPLSLDSGPVISADLSCFHMRTEHVFICFRRAPLMLVEDSTANVAAVACKLPNPTSFRPSRSPLPATLWCCRL